MELAQASLCSLGAVAVDRIWQLLGGGRILYIAVADLGLASWVL